MEAARRVVLRPTRGRDVEVGLVVERVRAAMAGAAGVVVVDGGSGSGKSQLLAEALSQAAALGVAVATATGAGAQEWTPYSILHRSLRVPKPDHASSADVLANIRMRLQERSANGPLVIALDDVHRTDPASVYAVAELTADLGSYPVLWLLSGRESAGVAAFQNLLAGLGRRGGVLIRLSPLSWDASNELVADIVGLQPGPRLSALIEAAAGNPVWLVELIEDLLEAGAIDRTQGVAELRGGWQPHTLESVIERRVERLSLRARAIVDVAAVLGRRCSTNELAAMMGESPARLLAGVRRVLDAGVLQSTDDVLAFRHSDVHSHIYAAIPDAVRSSLHAQAADLCLNRGDTAAAAGHVLQGVLSREHDDLAILDRAVREMRAVSPRAGADMAVRVLRLAGDDGVDRIGRELSTVETLVAARRLADAALVAAAALTRTDLPPEPRARLLLQLSTIHFLEGRAVEALAGIGMVLATPGLDDDLYDEAEIAQLLGHLTLGDMDRSRALAEGVLAGQVRPTADAVLAAALVALSFVAWVEGRMRTAVGLLRAATRRTDRVLLASRSIQPRVSLATMLSTLGQFAEASALMREITSLETASGTPWSPVVHAVNARLYFAQGRLDDAVSEAVVALELAGEFGTDLFVPIAEWVLASVALLRGEIDAAAQHISRYRTLTHALGTAVRSDYELTEARLASVQTGMSGAAEVLAPILGNLDAQVLLLVIDPLAAPFLVRVALAVGDQHAADSVVARAERIAADNVGFAALEAAAIHARGLVDNDATALEEAATRHVHLWAQATALEDAASACAARDPAAAAKLLERGLRRFVQMGATSEADRVSQRLTDLGSARRRRRQAERPQSGWSSLTDTERSIAELVAQGLSNVEIAQRLFMSRHTVDFHLRQIFRKLDVRSRVELTRLVAARARLP